MQIVELAAKLQSVGFTDKQAKVYVAALFLGPSAVQKIAEQADINRATAYVILDELANMGLVSESTQGKKTVFVAEPPAAIDRYLEAQAKALSAKKDELKSLLPGLNEMSRSTDSDDAPVVRFYKGEDGAPTAHGYFRRKAKANTVVYSMTNVDEVKKIIPDILVTNPKSRMKKKIASKVIYSFADGELPTSRTDLRETYRLPEEVEADINLYDDGVTFLSYRGKDSVGIIIESKDIAKALRQLFELAWKNRKK